MALCTHFGLGSSAYRCALGWWALQLGADHAARHLATCAGTRDEIARASYSAIYLVRNSEHDPAGAHGHLQLVDSSRKLRGALEYVIWQNRALEGSDLHSHAHARGREYVRASSASQAAQ